MEFVLVGVLACAAGFGAQYGVCRRARRLAIKFIPVVAVAALTALVVLLDHGHDPNGDIFFDFRGILTVVTLFCGTFPACGGILLGACAALVRGKMRR